MKKILLIFGIVLLSIFSITKAENFKYVCLSGNVNNSCFDGSISHFYDFSTKTNENQGYWKALQDVTFDLNYYINGNQIVGNTINMKENDILTMTYTSKTSTSTGYNFKDLKFYKNQTLVADYGDLNNVNYLKMYALSNYNNKFLAQNQRKLSTSMDLQSASVTDQISILMSGKFVTMLATIIAIIALFAIIIKYILRAIFK